MGWGRRTLRQSGEIPPWGRLERGFLLAALLGGLLVSLGLRLPDGASVLGPEAQQAGRGSGKQAEPLAAAVPVQQAAPCGVEVGQDLAPPGAAHAATCPAEEFARVTCGTAGHSFRRSAMSITGCGSTAAR